MAKFQSMFSKSHWVNAFRPQLGWWIEEVQEISELKDISLIDAFVIWSEPQKTDIRNLLAEVMIRKFKVEFPMLYIWPGKEIGPHNG